MNTVCKLIAATSCWIILLTSSANAAKVDPIAELIKFPENSEEVGLWDVASEHENNLGNSGRLFHDRHVEAYLESITDKMLGDHLDHLGISIDFILVKEPTLSGWVYPYGTIAVHTGLLAGMENEAQLAAILAHEISHFLQRHSYRELITERRQTGIGKGLGLLAALAVASQTGTVDTGIMDATGGLWTGLVTNGYSRKLEYVADEEGLELMANANYSRDEALKGFAALADNDVYGTVKVALLWSSHPKLEARLDNLEKEIKKEQRKMKDAYRVGVVPESAAYYRGVAPALIINANLDIESREFGRARMALTKYISVEPDNPEAEFLMGETYRKQAPDGPDFAPRLEAYQKALQKDSGYAAAHKEIGMAYRQQRMNSDALAAFERYLEFAPEAADAGIIRAYMDGMR